MRNSIGAFAKYLDTILDALLEHTVLVTDTVTPGGHCGKVHVSDSLLDIVAPENA
jgi:hypothetical protein